MNVKTSRSTVIELNDLEIEVLAEMSMYFLEKIEEEGNYFLKDFDESDPVGAEDIEYYEKYFSKLKPVAIDIEKEFAHLIGLPGRYEEY